MANNFLQIRNGVTYGSQSSVPTNPVSGDTYYDSTRNTFVEYINGGWKDLQSRTDVATAATLTSANFPTTTVQSSLVRLTGGTSGTISGFAAMPDAKTFVLYNESTAAITLLYNSGTEGTAANRIITPSQGALNINPGYSVTLAYDGSQARWVVVSTPSLSSGNGTGDDLDSLNFSVSFTDTFPDQPTSTLTSVNVTAGTTNATYSAANQYYTMSYDASRTVTGTTTLMHLVGGTAPAFTVALGDILRVGTQARKITVLGTINSDGGITTPFQIEAAFTTNPTAAACNVSQAVYTKDLNNFAVDGDAPSAIFTANLNSFILIYNDTTSGTIYNYTDPALVAYTASCDGTNYTSVSVREANPSVEATTNSAPTSGSNLYFRFFSNASTSSGTVNLVGYKTFFQSQNAVESGGVVNQAYAFTNGVETPYNATVSGAGTNTTLTLTWSYPVGINSGGPDGSLSVFLNGQKIPRFINSTLTPDASYTEVSGNQVQLDRDYSSQNLNVEVLQQAYIVDSNTQNSTNIAYINSSQFRNYLINGNMDLWQRGTSVTVANGASTYQADRFYVKNSLGTSGIITYSQTAGVNPGAKYGASVQITTAPTAAQTNGTEFYQVIENFNTLDLFINGTISAQAQIKALGAVTQVGIQFAYATTEAKPTLFFGTEQLVTVNTSTFTFGQLLAQTVPTSTITTSGVVGIRIRITAVSAGNLYALNNGFVVEQAAVNIGGANMPFARCGRSFQEEVQLCQRYYEKSYDLTTSPTALVDTGSYWSIGSATVGGLILSVVYKAQKRVAATIATNNPFLGGASWENSVNSSSLATSLSNNSTNSFAIGTSGTPAAGTAYRVQWSADSEI